MDTKEAHGDVLELNACTYLSSFGLEDESCCEGIGLEQLEQLLAEAGSTEQAGSSASAVSADVEASAGAAATYCPGFLALPHLSADDSGGMLYGTTYTVAPSTSSYSSAASSGTSSSPTSPVCSASDAHSPRAHTALHATGLSEGYRRAGPMLGVAVTSSSKLSPLMTSISNGSDGCSQKKRKLGSARGEASQASIRVHSVDDGNEFEMGDGADTHTEDSNDTVGGGSRTIKWHQLNSNGWHKLLDKATMPVQVISCHLDADKGINYSAADSSFISQKKNHFQVTCIIAFSTMPRYVVMPDQTQQPIDGIYIHMYGVKKESPTQLIKIEQSQADRSKKLFEPMLVSLDANASVKLTIARLHFMETTNNNMRKKGKPNPDQRYFQLVVGLYAQSQGAQFPFVEYASDKIVVRASNPGQFESEPEVLWQKGAGTDAIYHYGQVGINSDRPDEALVVNGNVKVMGRVLQPSDERIKSDITEVDSRAQLAHLSQLRMYHFKLRDEFGDVTGLSKDSLCDTGVLAQQLYDVLPEAVQEAGDVVLSNGELVENLLVINKDRLFMESVGAVKELCKVTQTLESRVDEIEKINSRLATTKRTASVRSSASSTSSSADAKECGASSFKELEAGIKESCKSSNSVGKQGSSSASPIVSRRILKNIVISLIVIMCVCLGAIVTLYLLENYGSVSTTSVISRNVSTSSSDGGHNLLIGTDSTTNPAGCETWSLITAACANAMYSCPFVCGSYDVSMTADNVSGASLSAVTGTSSPGMVTTRDPSSPRRRRRQAKAKRQSNVGSPQWPDLFDLVSMTVLDAKSKNKYNLTREECLTCDIYCSTDCINYTLMLFVHTSFPISELVSLHFSPGPSYPANHSLVVASCGLSWDTNDVNSTCGYTDTLSSLLSLSQGQESVHGSAPASYLPKAFVMPVGILKKSKFKFRIGYGNVIKDRSICSLSNSSSDYMEININVVRTNYRCIDSLMMQIQADLAFLYFLQVPEDIINI